ncbi:hypothetical protein [Blautia faecis]
MIFQTRSNLIIRNPD